MKVHTNRSDKISASNAWQPISFDKISGWNADDHEAALSCFRVSATGLINSNFESRSAIKASPALIAVVKDALAVDPAQIGRQAARKFFETNFQPYNHSKSEGFVTGYYEPEVEASRIKTAEFSVPLYKRPDDLIGFEPDHQHPNLPEGFEFGRKTTEGVVEYFDRAQIENGTLRNRGLELFWLRSSVDAFFIHIQGSARLLLSDDETVRVSYAGKTGHPFTPIGKLLVEMGELEVQSVTMQTIRDWLARHPGQAASLMQMNRSFIFFHEVEDHDPRFGPVAAAGVQLTPGRSIAIDRNIHAYGTPIWINTRVPLSMSSKPLQRLLIAQDTGSAIVGPTRGDLFIGSGNEAGVIAGAIKHAADFFVLHPVG